MSTRTPSVTFTASIAPLQSAISIASDGGARVKVDIPESEMDAVVALMGMRGKVLRVTVEIQENPTYGQEAAKTKDNPRAARRPTDVDCG